MDTISTIRENPALAEALEFLRHEAMNAEETLMSLGSVEQEVEERSKQRLEKLRWLIERLEALYPLPGQLVTCETIERAHIEAIVARTTTLDEATRILDIDIATLYRKRKRWGLPMRWSDRSPPES